MPEQSAAPAEPLLRFDEVSVTFAVPGRRPQEVIRSVSLDVPTGGVVALVGGSGSGKTTLARTVTGALPPNARITAGRVLFEGTELTRLGERDYRSIRGRTLGYIPQDARLGLNPLFTAGWQAGEPLRVHTELDADARRRRVLELFERVGLPDPAAVYDRYPHELSGGQCQRVLIAAALALEPRLLIADEPTTALDVTVQKRILDLLARLVDEESLTMLMVTHDLAIAAERADSIVVLEQGEVAEAGTVREILHSPRHRVTRELISAAGLVSSRAPAEREGVLDGAGGAPAPDAVLVAEGVSKTFRTRGRHDDVRAVVDVSFRLPEGRTLGVVGESGSGKTTLARLLCGLVPPDSGTILLRGPGGEQQVTGDRRRRRALYRDLQIVYQNPYASLDPRMTVEAIVAEPLSGFRLAGRRERGRRVRELLDATGLPDSILDRYPAELSGGQRQRVAIARALAPQPRVIVCDEPVTALDVAVQQQILELLRRLQREQGLSYVFVSHDLGVIDEMADEVLVMHRGAVVERGQTRSVLTTPATDYVKELVAAIPGRDLGRRSSAA